MNLRYVTSQCETNVNGKRCLNVVYNDGSSVLYDLISLGVQWFQMSNDDFANKYGIDFTPQKYGIYDECRSIFINNNVDIEVNIKYDKSILSEVLKYAT